MAEIKSKDVFLSYNTGSDEAPVWKIVACSTSDGFTGSTDAVSINNKCQGDWAASLPGDKSWSFSNGSYAQKEAAANQISQDELFDLWASGEVGTWKIESIEPGEYLRQGLGWVSNLGETADTGDYLQFDLSITGTGEVVRTVGT
ncbi:phage tail protein [Cellulophaga phage phi18:2]|uniref:Phage tail protein n=2 Tax=Cellulophaga phage phi18:1 TaxID=1327982 RepID=S0A1E2_9CAUD|nr:phage tail protein [Cellulophaga phage phi18:1]AGO48502.1 phage tail protein [Cellulophaga phage phi18:1]AGO49216.1 phage tail protein [Cellulophaga phage phi18:2]